MCVFSNFFKFPIQGLGIIWEKLIEHKLKEKMIYYRKEVMYKEI